MSKSWEKWLTVEKWQKVGKSREKWEKMGKKWGKVGKAGKVGKGGENWRKVGKSGHFGFRFLPKSIGTSLYSMSMATSNMKLIGAFLINRVHKLFHHIFTKWPPAAILVFPICSKIDRVLPL